jgi:NAD+ diphosphatase
MLGFAARASTWAICVDNEEIAAADWYTRDQLTAELDAGRLGLPGPTSIAARLIQAWRDGELPL